MLGISWKHNFDQATQFFEYEGPEVIKVMPEKKGFLEWQYKEYTF